MEHTRNGDLKVSYEQELFGRRRNSTLPAYPDLIREGMATGPARAPVPPKSTPSRRRTYADGELDVFSAERYFKGAMDGDSKEGSATAVETVATDGSSSSFGTKMMCGSDVPRRSSGAFSAKSGKQLVGRADWISAAAAADLAWIEARQVKSGAGCREQKPRRIVGMPSAWKAGPSAAGYVRAWWG
ncbi:hypothetical protein TRIUR3_27019 [Triticum urartu]|uniref:Uncharacterized protein n=1 Tax=Triticum urartu TaxID=4572 RepID=M7YWI0_TRIUA|nr:hypothetical protein TRIUR3_27019 [Triticum urartu]